MVRTCRATAAWVLALFAAAGSPLSAQLPDDSLALSLPDAIQLARVHNTDLRRVSNDVGAAEWRVRRAYASFLPSLSLTGGLNYSGPGSQTFLTTTFQQSSATVASSYNATLRWDLSGRTLAEPGLQRAERDALEADIASARVRLETAVTDQYLRALQARANLTVQREQLARDEETLRLATGRFDVGQIARLDVRQAEVARGRSEVELLRMEQAVRIELLRLFRVIGVDPPEDVMRVSLSNNLAVPEPEWSLPALLDRASQRHPDLVALRAREKAARWAVRSARSAYLPTVSVQAGWSGFTQQFTNTGPVIEGALQDETARAAAAVAACENDNLIRSRLTDPLPLEDCSRFIFTQQAAQDLAQRIRDRNSVFPFGFTRRPFQASLLVSLPVFNSFTAAVGAAEAGARREDARLALRDREMELRALVTERYHDVMRAWRTIAIEERNRAAARDQLALATERYRLGHGSFLEVLEARLLAGQAERGYVDAVYDYRRSIVLLEESVGAALR